MGLDFLKGHMKKVSSYLLRRLLIKLLPYLLPVLGILVLFFFIIYLLFVLPKYIVQDVEAADGGMSRRMVAIFNTGNRDEWTLAKDQELYQRYLTLDQNWLNQFISQEDLEQSPVELMEGNAADKKITVQEVWGGYYDKDSGIPSERTQVKQHRISWALLAAVDRVLGDPIISGQRGRQPNPEVHFKKLEPQLQWQVFELYYRCSWSEASADGEGKVVMTKVYKHKIKILTEVAPYEAQKITYEWEKKHYYYRDPKSDFVEEAYYPVLTSSRQQGPYFEKLHRLLKENQLMKDSDLELVLNLAMNYDEEFKYDISYFSGNITELFVDTENHRYLTTDVLGGYAWPTGTFNTITSAYGWRKHPVLKELKFHKGVDIACPRGTPVVSAWKGRIILAGWVSGYGKTVMVNHGCYKTLYGHLESIEVTPGQEVSQGEEIGKADSTGLSTGDHLHFEIRTGDGETTYLDPVAIYAGERGT